MSAMDRLRSGLLGDGGVTGSAQPSTTAASGGPAAIDAGRGAADASLLALVDRLAGLLDRSALSELEVGAGETTLVLRKADGVAAAAAVAVVGAGSGRPTPLDAASRHGPAPAPAAAQGSAAEAAAGPPAHAVVAPLTGIYYASPSPTAPPFVTVGQEIVAGQVIGLIEAMKLFNEIKSDASGRISRVAVENGKLVKAKQILLEVVPL
jgi:acetyl-CoA carboxylase biotin carboxyl carrier protein